MKKLIFFNPHVSKTTEPSSFSLESYEIEASKKPNNNYEKEIRPSNKYAKRSCNNNIKEPPKKRAKISIKSSDAASIIEYKKIRVRNEYQMDFSSLAKFDDERYEDRGDFLV